MGHDIDIVDEDGYSLCTTRISFNWSAYSDYFHVRDIHGRQGYLVSMKIAEALRKLKAEGITPNEDMRVDDWGHAKDKSVKNSWDLEEYEIDRKCMFAHKLSRFKNLADEYPTGTWYSDQC